MSEDSMNESNWSKIPKGMCLVRMFHERIGKHCLHLHMKLNEGPWYDQPHVPAHSQGEAGYEEFWQWAEKNLPIWDYPEPVRNTHE